MFANAQHNATQWGRMQGWHSPTQTNTNRPGTCILALMVLVYLLAYLLVYLITPLFNAPNFVRPKLTILAFSTLADWEGPLLSAILVIGAFKMWWDSSTSAFQVILRQTGTVSYPPIRG